MEHKAVCLLLSGQDSLAQHAQLYRSCSMSCYPNFELNLAELVAGLALVLAELVAGPALVQPVIVELTSNLKLK